MKKILSLFLLVLGLFWASSAVAETNEWTDLKGRTLKAKFIKGDPQKVTVEWNGRRFDLPLNTLAPDSRKLALKLISAAAYEARKPGGSEGMQTWTDSRGRSLLARFVRADDVTVTLNLKGKDVDVPLASLSEKSRVQAKELRKKSSPKVLGSPSAPKLEPTSAEGRLDLSAEQIWSAPNGQAFKGRFVRATDANVTITTRTILGAERETVLPLSALSATSRTLAEKLNVLAKKAAKERAAFAKKRLRMKVPSVTEADLKKEHAWVNDANQTVRAYFVDADDAGVTVLFSNNPSRPYELPWEKISSDSQLLAEALRRKKEELEPKKTENSSRRPKSPRVLRKRTLEGLQHCVPKRLVRRCPPLQRQDRSRLAQGAPFEPRSGGRRSRIRQTHLHPLSRHLLRPFRPQTRSPPAQENHLFREFPSRIHGSRTQQH